jgi:hypothetical protein
MSVGEVAQITAAFVVVLARLNWLVDKRIVYPPATSSPRFWWRWTILNATPMGRTA